MMSARRGSRATRSRPSAPAGVRGRADGRTRSHVIRATNGAAEEMAFRELNAKLPRVRLADPKKVTRLIGSQRCRRSPRCSSARRRDPRSQGHVRADRDSAWWSGMTAKLPASQLTGAAGTVLRRHMRLRLVGAPVTTADLRWHLPAASGRLAKASSSSRGTGSATPPVHRAERRPAHRAGAARRQLRDHARRHVSRSTPRISASRISARG